jgi:hypothetical protein
MTALRDGGRHLTVTGGGRPATTIPAPGRRRYLLFSSNFFSWDPLATVIVNSVRVL